MLTGDRIRVGDALIGLPSSGLHTNGYSLARRITFDTLMLGINDHIPEIGGGIGEALLRPHRSYLNPVLPLVHDGLINAMAHITGGGLTDNVPRVLPEGTSARIDRSAWDVPALFTWLVREGDVPDADAWRTFNMGIGMVLVVPAQEVNRVLERLAEAGESEGCVIGEIVSGSGDVQYVGIDYA